MEERLISFGTAKLAKEKGFDGFCFDAYNTHKMKYSDGWLEYIDDNEIEIPFTSKVLKPKDILAPTQSLLQKWLREVHNLIVVALPYTTEEGRMSPTYIWMIYKVTASTNKGKPVFLSYEEALEDGLIEALKLI